MKKSGLFIVCFLVFIINWGSTFAQLRFKVAAGLIYIDSGDFSALKKPDEKKYAGLTDSLNKNLKVNPNDTTSLFFRALLYLSFNDIKAKPYQRTNGALENLTTAKKMAEKAVSLKMQNLNLKILRAEIYRELTYRFTGDESWMFSNKQKAERKGLFNNYKALANKYYDDLAESDRHNAYDYQRLKITDNYPL